MTIIVENHQLNVIDKGSPIPAYQQITADMIDRISQDEWDEGDRLPSENELAEYYGVSRVTLRQAMAQLEIANYIVKRQGRGIFVTAKPRIHTQNIRFPTFSPQEKSGSSMISRDIRINKIPVAPKYVQKNLQIEEDVAVFYLQRLFATEDKVIGLNRAWMPQDLVPEFDEKGLVDSSISKTLTQRYHLDVIGIDNYVEAITLNLADANLLQTSYGTSALKIDSIHYFEGRRPIEYARTLWVSEYTRLQFSVTK